MFKYRFAVRKTLGAVAASRSKKDQRTVTVPHMLTENTYIVLEYTETRSGQPQLSIAIDPRSPANDEITNRSRTNRNRLMHVAPQSHPAFKKLFSSAARTSASPALA